MFDTRQDEETINRIKTKLNERGITLIDVVDINVIRDFEDWKYNHELLSKEFPFEKYFIWEDDDSLEINNMATM